MKGNSIAWYGLNLTVWPLENWARNVVLLLFGEFHRYDVVSLFLFLEWREGWWQKNRDKIGSCLLKDRNLEMYVGLLPFFQVVSIPVCGEFAEFLPCLSAQGNGWIILRPVVLRLCLLWFYCTKHGGGWRRSWLSPIIMLYGTSLMHLQFIDCWLMQRKAWSCSRIIIAKAQDN